MLSPDFGKIMSRIPSYAQGKKLVQNEADLFSDAASNAAIGFRNFQEMQRLEEEEKAKKELEEKKKQIASDIMGAWDLQELSDIELYGMPQNEIDDYERRISIFNPEMSDAQKYRKAASLIMPYDEEGAAQMLKYADARELKELEISERNKKEAKQGERVKLQTAYSSTLREAEGIRDNIRALQDSGDFDAARLEMKRLEPLKARLSQQYVALNKMSPEAYPMQPKTIEAKPEVEAGVNREILSLAQSAVSEDGTSINTSLFNDLPSDQRAEAMRIAKQEQELKRSAYEFSQKKKADEVARKKEQLNLEDLEAGSAAQIKAAGYWKEASAAASGVKPISITDYNKYQAGSGFKLIDVYNKTKNVSPELQSALQWVMPLLRADSGAAIGQEEIGNFIATYIPVEGDDANTILQKEKARQFKLEAMRKAAGRAAEQKIDEAGEMEYTTRNGVKYQRKKGTFAWKEVK